MKKEIIKGNARGKYIIRQSDIDYIITEKTDDGYVSVAIFNSKEDVRRYLITELNISDDEIDKFTTIEEIRFCGKGILVTFDDEGE